MRVGEARALEIGHRIGLAPDDVVQDPESLVLQLRADTKDVVVAADHPQRTVILQDAARRLQPFGGRSEEHTSELQSLMRISYAVFCLKKKIYTYNKCNKLTQISTTSNK